MLSLRFCAAAAAAAAVLAMVPGPAVGQTTPASRPMLAPGEVPLTVASKGQSIFPADRAVMTLNLRCPGATTAEAQVQVRQVAGSLTNQLLALGIARDDITVDEPVSRVGFVGNEAIDEMAGELPSAEAKPTRYASLSLKVVINDLSQLPRVKGMLTQKNALFRESPAYELKNDKVARRVAIADAIGKARTDADAYAAALNMRIARIAGVTDQAAQPSMMGSYAEMIEQMISQKSAGNGKVETTVSVAVDFVLAPR